MKQDEFDKIATNVMSILMDKFERDGMSPGATLAAALTMTVFASELSERLYSCDEIEIER